MIMAATRKWKQALIVVDKISETDRETIFKNKELRTIRTNALPY